jgi:hypothetical protein
MCLALERWKERGYPLALGLITLVVEDVRAMLWPQSTKGYGQMNACPEAGVNLQEGGVRGSS